MSSKTHNDESSVGGRDVDCDAVASRYRAAQLRLKRKKLVKPGGTLANLPRQSLST